MRLIVLNPQSQNGKGGLKWDSILSHFQNDLIFRVEKDQNPKTLADWLVANATVPAQPLIAAGGDGTVHSLIQLIQSLKLNVTLGMIGLGSSNDYHKPLMREGMKWLGKIPTRIKFDQAIPMDLIELTIQSEGKTKTQWSALNASVGMTANGNAIFNDRLSFPSKLKKISVDLAITAAALQAYFVTQPLELEIEVDGGPRFTGNFVTLGIFKRANFAGSLHFDRAPEENDGMLGFAVTEACSKIQQLKILAGLSHGQFAKQKNCRLEFHQKISIYSKRPFTLEIDGETQSVDNVQIRVLQNALRMCP